MSTLDDILASVRLQMGRLARAGGADHDAIADDVDSDNAQLTRYAEEAAADIARRSDAFMQRATLSVTAGTASYMIPAQVGPLLRAAYTPASGTTKLLDLVAGEAVRQWATASEAATETPDYAGIFAGRLWLYGLPDKDATLEVLYRPTSVLASADWASDEADVGDFVAYAPPWVARAVERFLLWQWFQAVARFDMASVNEVAYERILAQHRTARTTPQTTTRQTNQLI